MGRVFNVMTYPKFDPFPLPNGYTKLESLQVISGVTKYLRFPRISNLIDLGIKTAFYAEDSGCRLKLLDDPGRSSIIIGNAGSSNYYPFAEVYNRNLERIYWYVNARNKWVSVEKKSGEKGFHFSMEGGETHYEEYTFDELERPVEQIGVTQYEFGSFKETTISLKGVDIAKVVPCVDSGGRTYIGTKTTMSDWVFVEQY